MSQNLDIMVNILKKELKFFSYFKWKHIDWFHFWKLCAHGRFYTKFMIFWVYKVFCMPNPMVSSYKGTNNQKGSKMAAEYKMATKNKMATKKKSKNINDTCFKGFLGSRNQMKMLVLVKKVNFRLKCHLKVILR